MEKQVELGTVNNVDAGADVDACGGGQLIPSTRRTDWLSKRKNAWVLTLTSKLKGLRMKRTKKRHESYVCVVNTFDFK